MGEIDPIEEVQELESGSDEDYDSDGNVDLVYRALRQNDKLRKVENNTDVLLAHYSNAKMRNRKRSGDFSSDESARLAGMETFQKKVALRILNVSRGITKEEVLRRMKKRALRQVELEQRRKLGLATDESDLFKVAPPPMGVVSTFKGRSLASIGQGLDRSEKDVMRAQVMKRKHLKSDSDRSDEEKGHNP